MKYDKTKPSDIYNEAPQKDWPFKRGQKVYVLVHKILDDPYITIGTVTFYNPATHDSLLISKGHPIVTVKIDGKHTYPVGLDQIQPFTKCGLLCLEKKITNFYVEAHEKAKANMLTIAEIIERRTNLGLA